jgi:mannose-6-phosphate isomerase-like protein (cupin superfamily)
MRRVVTGINDQGHAVFARDEANPHSQEDGDFAMGTLWATSPGLNVLAQPTDPAAGKLGSIPKAGETACIFCTLPPQDQLNSADGSDTGDFDLEDGMFHTTDTVDYGVVVSGELWLELDNGQRKLLRAGDSFIQNGTRHAWYNLGREPATLFVAMIGAERHSE